jgi:hypothetical protein
MPRMEAEQVKRGVPDGVEPWEPWRGMSRNGYVRVQRAGVRDNMSNGSASQYDRFIRKVEFRLCQWVLLCSLGNRCAAPEKTG